MCAYQPISNTVIYDCIPENQAPSWWKTPLMGPAFSSGMVGAVKEPKSPGCNGGVCYCNSENYCNDRCGLFFGLFFPTFFDRHNTVMETECPDYLEHFRTDVRCKDYKEGEPEE